MEMRQCVPSREAPAIRVAAVRSATAARFFGRPQGGADGTAGLIGPAPRVFETRRVVRSPDDSVGGLRARANALPVLVRVELQLGVVVRFGSDPQAAVPACKPFSENTAGSTTNQCMATSSVVSL